MILPSLSAMEALDTLARTGSVTRTAEELNVSQSAISHKLKSLEARLGFALTEARGRRVVLTSAARRYVAAIRPALGALRDAHRGLGVARGPLDVAVVSGLAAPWLGPRIGRFLNAYPEISLTLRSVATGEAQADCDLSICFTDAPPPDAEHLLDVAFFPVCRPDFLSERGGLTLDRIEPGMLLHLHNRTDWARWLEAAGGDLGPLRVEAPGHKGRPPQQEQTGVLFTGLLAMYSAAEAGAGICLGDVLTCAISLNSGRLVRPFETEIPVPAGYWMVPAPGGLTAPASAFVEWLRAELAD